MGVSCRFWRPFSLATQQVPSIDMLLRHRQMRHVAALGVLAMVDSVDLDIKKGWISWRFFGECLDLPSGKHTKSSRKCPFIVDLPIENGDVP